MKKPLSSAKALWEKVLSFFHKVLSAPLSPWKKTCELFLIRALYVFLTVLILNGRFYLGNDGYRICFVFWKELVALPVFLGINFLYLKFPAKNTFLRCILCLVQLLYIIPLNAQFAVGDTGIRFFIYTQLYSLLLLCGVSAADRWLSRRPLKRRTPETALNDLLHNRFLNIATTVICLLYILYKLAYNGLDFSLSITSSEVYASRAEHQAYLQEISGTLFAYVLALVRYIAPTAVTICLVSSLTRKNIPSFLCAVVCILSMYSVSMQKSTLFAPILTVIVFILWKAKLLQYFERIATCGILLMLVFCAAEHYLLGSDSVFMLFIRREMYIPAYQAELYYTYFSENAKVCWTQQTFLLQNIFTPVYDVSPLVLINNAFFNGKMPSPNAGLFAEAYMHFGVLGVFLYPGLLAVVLTGLSRIYHRFGELFSAVMAVRLILQLTNVPIVRTDFVVPLAFFSALLLFVIWLDRRTGGAGLQKRRWGFLKRKN